MQKLYSLEGNERCLFRGLGNNAISGRERSRNLPGENCQREIPRADANEDTTATHAQLVALTCRTRQ